MSHLAANANKNRRARSNPGILPDDLRGYLQTQPWPRVGRPQKQTLCDWTIGDDWPEYVPVTSGEVDVFEAWFGDIFDQLLGVRP